MKKTLAVSVLAVSLTMGAPAALAADTGSTKEACTDTTGDVLLDKNGEAIAPDDDKTSPSGKYLLMSCDENYGAVPVFYEPEDSMSLEDRAHYEDAFFAEHYAEYEELYNEDGSGWAYLIYPGDFGKRDGTPMTPERFGEVFIEHMNDTSVYKDDEFYEDHDYNFDEDGDYDDPVYIAAGVETSADTSFDVKEHEDLKNKIQAAKQQKLKESLIKWGAASLTVIVAVVGGFFGYRRISK